MKGIDIYAEENLRTTRIVLTALIDNVYDGLDEITKSNLYRYIVKNRVNFRGARIESRFKVFEKPNGVKILYDCVTGWKI